MISLAAFCQREGFSVITSYSIHYTKLYEERQIILEECQEELNEKGENVDIDDQACRLLYQGNPLSWQTIGTQETIAAMDEATLRQAFSDFYVPGNMVLAAAGPIRHEDFIALVRRYFSSYNFV